MWVARDKDGELWIFFVFKPFRDYQYQSWFNDVHFKGDGGYAFNIDDNLFPDLTWEDEPLEVDLIPKK